MTRLAPLDPDPATGRPRWELVLLPMEGAIVKGLPNQLESLLSHPDSNRRVIDRLFPASYADPEEERQNRQLLGDGLLAERRAMLRAVRALLDGSSNDELGLSVTLDEASLDLMLRFLNDVRLVLATDLGIETNLDAEAAPDPNDPDAPKQALLEYLGGLEAMLVDAVSREL